MRFVAVPVHLFLVVLLVTGCEKIIAYGRPNEVVVVASPDLWPILQDSVLAILAPVVPPLRNEGTLHVTFEDPGGPNWALRRLAGQEVLIGSRDDPFIAQALGETRAGEGGAPADLIFAEDVWARNQEVAILLVDLQKDVLSQAIPLLRDLRVQLDQRFRKGMGERMFVSGRDEIRRDSLLETAGFGLVLPKVYEGAHGDSLFIFRNDNPDPRELIRQVAVTWRSPIPHADLDVDSLLAWKEEVSETSYSYPQAVHRESVETRMKRVGGLNVSEIVGTWFNPPGSPWPAGGPFLLRTIRCPSQDRLYLIDAWLYAPEKDKWEYLLQIETILASFQCGPASPHLQALGLSFSDTRSERSGKASTSTQNQP